MKGYSKFTYEIYDEEASAVNLKSLIATLQYFNNECFENIKWRIKNNSSCCCNSYGSLPTIKISGLVKKEYKRLIAHKAQEATAL